MYFHVVNLSFYLVFLSLITINGLKVIDVAHATQPHEESFNKESQQGWNQSYIQNLKMFNSESQREAKNVYFISIWVLIFVVLNILKEFYQIYHQVRTIIYVYFYWLLNKRLNQFNRGCAIFTNSSTSLSGCCTSLVASCLWPFFSVIFRTVICTSAAHLQYSSHGSICSFTCSVSTEVASTWSCFSRFSLPWSKSFSCFQF